MNDNRRLTCHFNKALCVRKDCKVGVCKDELDEEKLKFELARQRRTRAQKMEIERDFRDLLRQRFGIE